LVVMFREPLPSEDYFKKVKGKKKGPFLWGGGGGGVDLGADRSDVSRGRNGARFGSGGKIDPTELREGGGFDSRDPGET